MFLKRSLNHPHPPLQASFTATPSLSTTPAPIKILIIHQARLFGIPRLGLTSLSPLSRILKNHVIWNSLVSLMSTLKRDYDFHNGKNDMCLNSVSCWAFFQENYHLKPAFYHSSWFCSQSESHGSGISQSHAIAIGRVSQRCEFFFFSRPFKLSISCFDQIRCNNVSYHSQTSNYYYAS